MKPEIKLIESGPMYNLYESYYDEERQEFREWRDGRFEIKFTDEFARANGYKDRDDMAAQTGVRETLLAFYGSLPEWVSLNNGEYTFPIPNTGTTLN